MMIAFIVKILRGVKFVIIPLAFFITFCSNALDEEEMGRMQLRYVIEDYVEIMTAYRFNKSGYSLLIEEKEFTERHLPKLVAIGQGMKDGKLTVGSLIKMAGFLKMKMYHGLAKKERPKLNLAVQQAIYIATLNALMREMGFIEKKF